MLLLFKKTTNSVTPISEKFRVDPSMPVERMVPVLLRTALFFKNMCYLKAVVNVKVLSVVRKLSLSFGKGEVSTHKKTLTVKQILELLDL